MEDEEIERLEVLKDLLNRKISYMMREKQRLDRLTDIVKKINEKEVAFVELLSKLKRLNEKMLSYFDGSDISKEVQRIEQYIQQVMSDYEQRCSNIGEELAKTKFDDEVIDKYYSDVSSFLDAKIKLVNNLSELQRKMLDESIVKVKDELVIASRLMSALIKRVESSSKRDELRKFLISIQAQIEGIKNEFPLKIEDLEKIHEKTLESFKGLYERTRNDILSLRRELRRFAVENELVEKDEVTVLEALYMIAHEVNRERLELGEALELLGRKMPETSNEKIQDVLLSLSKKGFLTLTLTVK
jgi:hypothetical protein